MPQRNALSPAVDLTNRRENSGSVGTSAAPAVFPRVSGVQRLIGDLKQAPHIMALALIFVLRRDIALRARRIDQPRHALQWIVHITGFVLMRLVEANAHISILRVHTARAAAARIILVNPSSQEVAIPCLP